MAGGSRSNDCNNERCNMSKWSKTPPTADEVRARKAATPNNAAVLAWHRNTNGYVNAVHLVVGPSGEGVEHVSGSPVVTWGGEWGGWCRTPDENVLTIEQRADLKTCEAEAEKWRALATKNAAEAERIGNLLAVARDNAAIVERDHVERVTAMQAQRDEAREELRRAREEGVRAGIEAAALYVHDQELRGLARQIRESVDPAAIVAGMERP